MTQRNHTLVAGTVCAALALTACGDSDASSGGLPVQNEGELSVCISKNAYEPLYWKDGGELTGFDVDAITAIADHLELDVSFMEVAFDGLMPALDAGRCDVLRSGLYISEERTAIADAIPYMRTGPALIVPTDTADDFSSVEDLAGIRVAVQGASANETALLDLNEQQLEAEGLEPIEMDKYPELPETVAALENDRVDATIETDVAAIQAAETLGDEYTTVADIFEADTEYGMYLPKDSDLTDNIADAATELAKDNTFASLADEYGLERKRLVSPTVE